MTAFIPYGRQSINTKDIDAVIEILKSDWLTTGPQVEAFESELATFCGSRYAVVCSNGTAALHLAALALGLKPSEAIVTSPLTFLATANCARYVGSDVLFSDVDASTGNLDPQAFEKTIKSKQITTVKAVFPVHYAGRPADMVALHDIARSHGLRIVEDACHALGARYQDADGDWVRVGSCKHSDMTVFSFHPVKHITTGEGGAITTNDPVLYEKLKRLRNHGITPRPKSAQGEETPWYYEMNEPGFNYRLTDLQCALGRSQLQRLPEFLKKRQKVAVDYGKQLKAAFGEAIQTPMATSAVEHAYHLYPIQIDFLKLGVPRGTLMIQLKDKGIGTQVHYIPLHWQPYFQKLYRTKRGDYPVAETFYEKSLSLPIYPDLPDDGVDRVVSALKECLLSGVK